MDWVILAVYLLMLFGLFAIWTTKNNFSLATAYIAYYAPGDGRKGRPRKIGKRIQRWLNLAFDNRVYVGFAIEDSLRPALWGLGFGLAGFLLTILAIAAQQASMGQLLAWNDFAQIFFNFSLGLVDAASFDLFIVFGVSHEFEVTSGPERWSAYFFVLFEVFIVAGIIGNILRNLICLAISQLFPATTQRVIAKERRRGLDRWLGWTLGLE